MRSLCIDHVFFVPPHGGSRLSTIENEKGMYLISPKAEIDIV